jgi:hypothetical protein
MISAGIKAAAIHGNKDKAPVPKPGGFRRNPTALVATDIAARGLDIRYYRMLSILNCLILKITFTALVEQEAEQAEKLFRYSVRRNGFT